MLREDAIIQMLAAEELSDAVGQRLRLQMALIPIIDLRTAKSYINSMREVLDKQLALRDMQKVESRGKLTAKTMNRVFSALAEAGIVRLVEPTEENMDTTADSLAMRHGIATGKLKPLFGGAFGQI